MASNVLRFKDCENAINAFCMKNHLDFDKAKSMAKCFGTDLLWLQYHDQQKGSSGLYDETKMPVVLEVIRQNGEIIIRETEYTRHYLA